MKYTFTDTRTNEESEIKDGEEKFTDEVKKMVETKTPIPDWGAVEVCGKWYFIEYCL